MKKLYLTFLILLVNIVSAQQENGIVSFDLSAKNSLKFNKFIINPTFSFVREEKSTFAVYNKRLWTGFENPPQTLFLSYSGKLGENNGVALGVFQQNSGVLSTTGAVINYARNIYIDDESNLTFGLNLSAFKSGLDAGKVITNFTDPVLNNFPSNTLLSISPGINYGTGFLDFGIAAKNVVFYNLKTSKMLSDDPAKSIDAHIMYTGFLESDGILEDAKFSAIARGELRKDATILATTIMLNAPKVGWLQAGFNTVYGVSGGVGFNIAKNFSLGATYEKALGNIVDRGSALEFLLAYHFSKSEDDGYSAPVSTVTYAPKNVEVVTPPADIAKAKAESELQKQKDLALAKQKRDDIAAKAIADAKLKTDKLEQERVAIQKAKELADLEKNKPKISAADLAKQKAKELADAKAIADAEKAKIARDARQKADDIAKVKAKQLADAKLNADQLAKQKAKEAADAKAIADAEKAKIALEAKQKADELAKIKAKELADAKTVADAEKTRIALAAKQKVDELAKAKAKEQADKDKAKADAEAEKLKKDLEDAKIAAAKDDNDRSMDYLKQVTEENTKALAQSLKRLDSLAKSRQSDLNDLKEENDTGIIKPEKPFQSASIARKQLESLKSEIEEGTKSQTEFISQFDNLLKERLKKIPSKTDAINLGYQKSIDNLKSEILKLQQVTTSIDAKLEKINADIVIEKKRNIKKANFENGQGRYEKDRSALQAIKQSTTKIPGIPKPEDFDFGSEENNMQILKKIDNTTTGFYIILAVHKDVAKRDAFIGRVVASGENDVDFFYSVSSGKYFIYIKKTDNLSEATRILNEKDGKGYNSKRNIIKIEN